jgi:hypothetical protein
MTNNQRKSNRGGYRAGAGRKKGVPNKVTGELKDMILGALSEAGGQQYLLERAKDNPVAFMTLVGKVLPYQVTGEGGGPVRIEAPWLAGRSV